MCGIVGFFGSLHVSRETGVQILERMTDTLVHRGPDASGVYLNPLSTFGFGHRRLAILDLSPGGAQPMHMADESGSICFNGEIYNFAELRRELEQVGVRFRGSSDTEVLLSAFVQWGFCETLPRLNGMFAVAYWDARAGCGWLARDRFGEKPLYYSFFRGVCIFASELKALRCFPGYNDTINESVLPLYLRFNYIPAPHSIYKNTLKLPAGHFLRIENGRPGESPVAYWSLKSLTERRERLPKVWDEGEMVEQVDQVLRRAVGARMVADVPIGAFLSGGVDSSAIVAAMQAQSSRRVKTFTIGFWEAPYNEAVDAAKVAKCLGTEHHEYYISSRECIDVISRLPEIYDEPFADSSQVPTALVSMFTRRHVTVALSGDGGDELWGGYNRYFWTQRLWKLLEVVPLALRLQAAAFICGIRPASLDRFVSIANRFVPAGYRIRYGGDKLHKFADALACRNTDELYTSFVSQWKNPSAVLVSSTETPFLTRHMDSAPSCLGPVERMMYLDLMTYLCDDILCKVDRASMSTGLEVRVPFLDNDLVDLAWRIPIEYRMRGGVGKWLLRRVLQRYLPSEHFERPKVGFGIPIGDWIRGPLRPWAEALLSHSALSSSGFLRSEAIRIKWTEHLSGKRNYQHELWGILMFQAWLFKARSDSRAVAFAD
jgi:asparagine synthase (glutamine-hydrolysing)